MSTKTGLPDAAFDGDSAVSSERSQAYAPPVQPAEARWFGKYELISEIAVGGMAELFVAAQRGVEGFLKVVALKRMLPHLAQSSDLVKMFIAEAKVVARLDHPNVIRVYEFGECEGQYYLAMEYVPGEDLNKLLRRAHELGELLPLDFALTVMMGVCDGLHCAHELVAITGEPLGIVHRDVSPANILISYNGEVKVVDFGVVKVLAEGTVTRAGTTKGKLAYMSPEQISASALDRRSDVFSAGIVLWEMLTCRPLFARSSDAATLYAVMQDRIPAVSELRGDVPPALSAVVERALARDPAHRFATCAELRAALQRVQRDLALELEPRGLGRIMEYAFGAERAAAKRAIAQGVSAEDRGAQLRARHERTSGSQRVAGTLSMRSARAAAASGAARGGVTSTAAPGAARRAHLLTLSVLVASSGGLAWIGAQHAVTPLGASPPPRASASLDSAPPGARILLSGAPTGLTTPAVLSGLRPGRLDVRVELAGHRSALEVLDIKAGESVTQRFALERTQGRLVLVGLSDAETVRVDGREFQAGEVITLPTGLHHVQVMRSDELLVEQQLELDVGDSRWVLRSQTLVKE